MKIMSDFFFSDVWRDVQSRVVSTFALSGVGTVTNAINNAEQTSMVQSGSSFPIVLEVITLVSYGFSILVAITVLWRFCAWLSDRNKTKRRR